MNQIVHASNDRLEHDVAVCVKHRVPIIITSLRPPAEVVSAVHGYGGIVFHDVINLRHAEKAAEQGVDGIIAVCAGAGGHAGVLSPFALVKQIREVYSGTIILAGAHEHRRRRAGGAGAWAPISPISARASSPAAEANASPAYKQMVVDSSAEDIVYTSLFSGVAGNYLRDSVKRTGLDPDNLPAADKAKMNFAAAEPRVQGVAGYLERRPERQRHPRGVAGERAGRSHGCASTRRPARASLRGLREL